MTPCVCGCDCTHPEHCPHGCTCPHPDDGGEYGGPTTVARTESYNGVYANRRWV